MGKLPDTTAQEQRLRELIQEANAATKDLTKVIAAAKREVVEFTADRVDGMIRDVVNTLIDIRMEGVEKEFNSVINVGLTQILEDFHGVMGALIGMDIYQAVKAVMRDPENKARAEMMLGKQIIQYARAAQARAEKVGDHSYSRVKMEWTGNEIDVRSVFVVADEAKAEWTRSLHAPWEICDCRPAAARYHCGAEAAGADREETPAK